jgi:RNA polymerase sigma-70 factor (ECF subfamily)
VHTSLYDALVSGRDFTDDDVLVKALVVRDRDAFAFLLDRYHGSLMRLALQYVPNRAVAEEVVQETWVAVLQGVDRFEQRSSVKTWLYRILVNIARSRGVKEHRSIPFASFASAVSEPPREAAVDGRRFHRFGRKAGGWKSPPDPWPGPEQQVLAAESLGIIDLAIQGLPAAQREVLTMRDVLGWTAPEVCDALEVSETNQRVLLHRARSKVRAVLERHYAEGDRL